GDIMRAKYRNSFEPPEPMKPGELTKIRFDMQDVAHTFLKGHKIMVQIQSTWFPLANRNPQVFTQQYKAPAESYQKATHRAGHPEDTEEALGGQPRARRPYLRVTPLSGLHRSEHPARGDWLRLRRARRCRDRSPRGRGDHLHHPGIETTQTKRRAIRRGLEPLTYGSFLEKQQPTH
ncbi:MAG: hypothetical protein HRU14_14875, partial [Planctomycetes bacterium]|nr:hypothetical protein [Planctomycetota bacterium]